MRVQKFMAEAGIASRRQCETYIEAGRVSINGQQARLGAVIDPHQDTVCLDGKPVAKREEAPVVVLFYKPRGVVCTNSDPQGRKTVQDFFKTLPVRLYHVGRLDIQSEGLLIMTNDGALAQHMTHPRYKTRKTYYVVCDGVLTSNEAAQLQSGVMLDDGITLPAIVSHIRPTKTGKTSFEITIREGRNRQVRRMVEAVGHKTLLLKREKIGALSLAGLKPGEWRYATPEEYMYLQEIQADE